MRVFVLLGALSGPLALGASAGCTASEPASTEAPAAETNDAEVPPTEEEPAGEEAAEAADEAPTLSLQDLELGKPIAEGIVSFYSDKLAGRPTASGAPYDPEKMTCAHLKLKFGTKLVIERKSNGKRTHCVVNDRGPYSKTKILDLSRAAAEELEMDGVAQARIYRMPDTDPAQPEHGSHR